MDLQIGRVYGDEPAPPRAYRVLVDRLWPRGVRKEGAPWDAWWKELTPSDALRRWLHQDPEARWEGFQRRYREELDALGTEVTAPALAACREHETVVLLTAARNPERSHVRVLRQWLLERLGGGQVPGPGASGQGL